MKKFLSFNLKANQRVVKEIIKVLFRNKIFLLQGSLGSGKTTLVKEIAKNLKIKENITSPTFILWQKYQFQKNGKKYFLNHIDLYRLKANDVLKLNLKKEINNSRNIFFIEWGEKLESFLKRKKKKYMKVIIEKKGPQRIFIIK